MSWLLRFSILFFTLILSYVNACTGVRMTAKDGSSINGRTVEFGTNIDIYACIVPRNLAFTGTTPKGKGLSYKSKYAVIGMYCFTEKVVMDGINEKGLSCGTFYFPGYASYAKIDKSNQSKALSPVEFSHWILTQFATLDEVKNALDSVVIAPTVSKDWGPTPPPFHYIVYDKQGRSLVIEPLEGSLVSYENKIGAFTNSPTFDWHMTHLRNFINLTPFNVKPISLRGVDLAPFGQGSGMVGLPGDFTPPSRFVKAAIFSSTAVPSETNEELVGETFHILNQFNVPFGLARGQEDGKTTIDYTQFTAVKDPNSLRYYFKSYNDQNIKWIAFEDFDLNGKSIKSTPVKGKNTTFNVSKTLR